MPEPRKIIHIDMDAFYAAIEQRDNPQLRGRPVVVGGSSRRGVVATASYEARRFGIRSAMPSVQAQRLCPHAVFLPARFAVYRAASQQIMAIAREYSEFVEPLSLDEAYIDATSDLKSIGYATKVAQEIRSRIFRETELTASAGVAPNKFLAKVASDMNKPDGLSVIVPDRVELVLRNLPVRKIPGIGSVTEGKLHKLGVRTVGDLRALSERQLTGAFGKMGGWFYRIARGEDNRPVVAHRERKSLSVERTFRDDICKPADLEQRLSELADELEERLSKRQLRGRTFTLKITYSDFEKVTRSTTEEEPPQGASAFLALARSLLSKTEAGIKPVRLLGLGISSFVGDDADERPLIFETQLELWERISTASAACNKKGQSANALPFGSKESWN